MSSIAQSLSRTGTRAEDPYDHEIKLIDTTVPQINEPDTPSESRSSSKQRGLVKRLTGTSVREELARRKYARWQEGRFNEGEIQIAEEQAAHERSDSTQPLAGTAEGSKVQDTDFGASQQQDRGRSKKKKAKKNHKAHKREKETYEVDILYENQRGSFFCGIPLYSSKSLLNFDPSPWVTRDFKDSAVDITNAQVPDPSWQWAWKSWYVDMSHDVDEEGWQYSFSFSPKFSWHGTHPWFTSFVRRRRWLRKRIKRHHAISGKAGDMQQAHMLTGDYFTIHPRRDLSPGSTTGRSSYLSRMSTVQDEEPVEEDIKDIPALLKALKRAAVDREKLDAVKSFVQHGGDELHYLEENIPEVMSQFVFQNSRRQLLTYLLHTVEEAAHSQGQPSTGKQREDPAAKHRVKNLEEALKAAEEEVKSLEYWSDVKNVEKLNLDSSEETEAFRDNIIGARDDPEKHKGDEGGHFARGIRGISEQAEASIDRTRLALQPEVTDVTGRKRQVPEEDRSETPKPGDVD